MKITVICLMMYYSLNTVSLGVWMMTNEIIVCGLLPIEQELLKHKGKCRACMYNDSYLDRKEHVQFCSKDHKRLKNEKTNCNDWLLDTR